MTNEQFRKIALSFPKAVESAHQGHPDFRVGGKIFATLGTPSENRGMVKLTSEQQLAWVKSNTIGFLPCNGAWGRQGCTYVDLAIANPSLVRSALQLAFEHVSSATSKKAKSDGVRSRTRQPKKQP